MYNRFITFSQGRECNCSQVLPVCYGADMAFETDFSMSEINFVSQNGDVIKQASPEFNEQYTFALLTDDLSKIFAPGDCFMLCVKDNDNHLFFSNTFVFIGCDEEDTLLFEFYENGGNHFKVRLHGLLSSPQPKTDKTQYETSNGHVITLSKKRRKEYEAEFYFYPESVHDSIEEMLCFPNLTVNEVPMFESGDYEIQWKEKDENGNARSTTKLSEQTIKKYSY